MTYYHRASTEAREVLSHIQETDSGGVIIKDRERT
jgi:hypothetical protein